MAVTEKSLSNLVKQKSVWNHKPTVARRFPAEFIDKIEAIAHKLDSGENFVQKEKLPDYDSLSTLEIQKLRMKLSLIIEKRSLIFSGKFNYLIESIFSRVNEEEKKYIDWIGSQIDSCNQLVRIHARNACLIINKYIPFKDDEEMNKVINTYPSSVHPIERNIDENGKYIEGTPESCFVYRRDKIRCYSPYDETGETQSRFKKLPEYSFSSRKHGGDNSWFFPEECAKFIVKDFQDFYIDNSVVGFVYYCQYKKLQKEKQKAEEARKKAEDFADFLANLDIEKYGLFKHQTSGVKWLVQKFYSPYKGAILADQMGLGKTWIAAIAAHEICKREGVNNLLVICPASLIGNWSNELAKLGIKAEVFSDSYQKIPEPLDDNYLVIVDEAHGLQNDKSKRFKAVEKLILGSHFKGLFMLTGTPIKNGRPINLYPLLKLLNHPIAFKKGDYEKRYCDAHVVFNRWDNSGAINLDELAEKTADCILQRKKENCLDLPEKIRSVIELDWVPDVEKKYFDKYKKMWKKHLDKINSGEIKSGAEAVVKINILRQCSSEFKIDWCIDLVEDLISEGQKVVVFSEFLDTIQQLSKKLNKLDISCRELIGATPSAKRTRDIQDFQEGEYDVFLGSTKAGGVGITLTNASNLILLDRPWTPGDADQAEDRIHRIGQTKSANIYWPQLAEIDKIIDSLLQSKSTNIDIVLAGKSVSFQNDNLPQLQQQIVKYYEDEYGI